VFRAASGMAPGDFRESAMDATNSAQTAAE
jgi:hypothetical protein